MALDFAHGSVQWLTTDALNATKVITTATANYKKVSRETWEDVENEIASLSVSHCINE